MAYLRKDEPKCFQFNRNKDLRLRGEQPAVKHCFDNLGTENYLKYFGNECNVIAEILLSRCELFTIKNCKPIS